MKSSQCIIFQTAIGIIVSHVTIFSFRNTESGMLLMKNSIFLIFEIISLWCEKTLTQRQVKRCEWEISCTSTSRRWISDISKNYSLCPAISRHKINVKHRLKLTKNSAIIAEKLNYNEICGYLLMKFTMRRNNWEIIYVERSPCKKLKFFRNVRNSGRIIQPIYSKAKSFNWYFIKTSKV